MSSMELNVSFQGFIILCVLTVENMLFREKSIVYENMVMMMLCMAQLTILVLTNKVRGDIKKQNNTLQQTLQQDREIDLIVTTEEI